MDDREFGILEPYAKVFYTAHGEEREDEFWPLAPWDGLARPYKEVFAEGVDAVLAMYDPEWQSRKAGM